MSPASLKARRLLATKRVKPKGTATMYAVLGDSGVEHLVVLAEGFAYCSCPANRERCSHVEAAEYLDVALVVNDLQGATL